MILISVNLSKLPKESIKVGTDGNKYINLILSERKEKGRYDETHTLAVSKTKEEREAGVATIYVGSGTLYEQKPAVIPTPENIEAMPPIKYDDDLPF